jgi:hypothetical protein
MGYTKAAISISTPGYCGCLLGTVRSHGIMNDFPCDLNGDEVPGIRDKTSVNCHGSRTRRRRSPSPPFPDLINAFLRPSPTWNSVVLTATAIVNDFTEPNGKIWRQTITERENPRPSLPLMDA